MNLDALDQFFQFSVGAWVRPKSDPTGGPMLIVGRLVVEYRGGVYVYYRFRAANENGPINDYIDFNEIELVAAESPEDWLAKRKSASSIRAKDAADIADIIAQAVTKKE